MPKPKSSPSRDQHGISMPLQLMVQNALRHYRIALTKLMPEGQSANAAAEHTGLLSGSDAQMALLIHRDCAAVHLAAAHVALDTTSSGSGVRADTTVSVAMADFVRALDELAATAPLFDQRSASFASSSGGSGGSGGGGGIGEQGVDIDAAEQHLEAIWSMLLFALRSILKIGSSAAKSAAQGQKKHTLLTPAQGKLFRDLYLMALQCSRATGESGPAARVEMLQRKTPALVRIGSKLARVGWRRGAEPR